MAFNRDDFLAAFLGRVTKGIESRTEEAKQYEKDERSAAERNAPLIQTRQARLDQAYSLGQTAMSLGATIDQVLHSSKTGPAGIQKFTEALQTAANQRGMTTLGPSDIEQIVSMPNITPVDLDYADATSDELLKQRLETQYGLTPAEQAEQKEVGLMGTLFGFGDRAAVDKRLRDTEYMGGMSYADINALANQKEYQSIMPEATMVFTDVNFFTKKDTIDFSRDFRDIETKVLNSRQYIQAEEELRNAINFNTNLSEDEKKVLLEKDIKELRQAALIEGSRDTLDIYLGNYDSNSFFTSPTVNKVLQDMIGNEELEELKEIYGIEAPDAQEEETPTLDVVDTVITSRMDEDQPETTDATAAPAEDVQPSAPIDTAFPVAPALSAAQKEILRNKFAGSILEDKASFDYTRDQWKSMKRTEKIERGLPVSVLGGLFFTFRDDLDEILENRNLNIERKTNVGQNSYKIILGKKAYHVTAEELASMNDKFFDGLKPTLFLLPYNEGEESIDEKLTDELLNRFSK
jgi:hypothetical protein